MPKSPQRYAQLARALKILTLLEQARFGRTLQELHDDVVEQMGLSSLHLRSIQRDLQFLQDAGFNIEAEEAERGKVWKLSHNYLKIPQMPVSVLELLAFSAGRDLLVPLAGTPFWHGIETLWRRMRESLPDTVWKHFDQQRPGLIVRGAPPKSYAGKEGVLSTLNRAIYERRVLEIHYQSPTQKQPEIRQVEPHALVLFQGSVYVVAALPGETGASPFRQFKLDRLSKAAALDRRFKPRPNFQPDELFASSIGIFQGADAQAFRLRFAAPVARWVLETPFHPRQQVEEEADGGLLVFVASAYEAEILPRVLSLGEHAEVLEPAATRAEVRRIAKQLTRTYRTAEPE